MVLICAASFVSHLFFHSDARIVAFNATAVDIIRLGGMISHYPYSIPYENGRRFVLRRQLRCLKISLLFQQMESLLKKTFIFDVWHFYPLTSIL